ncbi:MAG: hypothetical protein ACLQLH_09680 [Terracidiphilus sp.]
MLRWFLRVTILAGCLSLTSLAATAQEVVNALIGTVRYIDSAAKTITITTDDGSDALFKDMINSKRTIEFDPNVRTDATAADEFKKSGVRAIVYYFGAGEVRTVVALRSLGPGPFIITSGTVVHFDKREHTLTIKDQSGAMKSFAITPDTVAETEFGAVSGLSFQPQKGDQVVVNAVAVNGGSKALFINTVIAN